MLLSYLAHQLGLPQRSVVKALLAAQAMNDRENQEDSAAKQADGGDDAATKPRASLSSEDQQNAMLSSALDWLCLNESAETLDNAFARSDSQFSELASEMSMYAARRRLLSCNRDNGK